jgi:mannose-1-phosphate guanylyltransferase/mannose-6-phosphate isomerase
MRIQPVILAGGTGTRLWPLSRELYPKQLLSLIGEHSLLQTTLIRISLIAEALSPIIIVGEEHRFLTRTQIEELNLFQHYQILLEPLGKDTAPAVCGAALFTQQEYEENYEDILLLILPADHLVARPDDFVRAVQRAKELAEQGKLATFGIVPDRPETGYGYICRGKEHAVQSFVEKPDLATAKEYVADSNYFWNSGMFAFPTNLLLAELDEYTPGIVSCMQEAVQKGGHDGVFFRFDPESMQQSPADSIDYALMERTQQAVVVEADFGWNDIGSWQALWEVTEKDQAGNMVSGDVLLEDVENCLIYSEDILVTAIGLRDTLVVETSDAVLVAPMDRSQDVKKIVNRIKKKKRAEFHSHRTVYRPWGSYTTLEIHDRFQIKRITVNPGARLSSQMHHHRHEHWVVVHGTARVENGDQEILLREDESTYIPLGTIHRLENPGVIPLELIEIQIGSYLGEDDIVRFDDEYGRDA